jgi:3-oxoacyl-[acyl-carrier-protein] synthase II
VSQALSASDLGPLDIDHINAHGNAMPDYDIAETNAFKSVFGSSIYSIPVSSIKSMIGQALAVAGTMQAVSTCLSLQCSVIPPTINYDTPDPQCDLDYVPNHARRARLRNVLLNSHGMGGTHSVAVLAMPS